MKKEYRLTTKEYERTESGKSWKSKPITENTKTISQEYYNNIASERALKYWNGFCGGTCRASRSYTYWGYIVTRITRINPERTLKIVEEIEPYMMF